MVEVRLQRGYTVWDGIAALGLMAVIASWSLAWRETQSCPLYEPCGGWETEAGWFGFGPWTAGAVVLAILVHSFVPDDLLRRGLAAFVVALNFLVLMWAAGWADFMVFGNARGPMLGWDLAFAGTAVAFVSLLVPVVQGMWGADEVRSADA